jgi:hypothetical protein
MCKVIRAPRGTFAAGSIVKLPLPSETQRQPSLSPALRLSTSTRSATFSPLRDQAVHQPTLHDRDVDSGSLLGPHGRGRGPARNAG